MRDSLSPDYPDVPAIQCELASGHSLRVEAREFWVTVSVAPKRYEKVFLIRVYSTEGSPKHRMEVLYELRAEKDFDIEGVEGMWRWLTETTHSPRIFDYDSAEDLVADMEAELDVAASCAHPLTELFRYLPPKPPEPPQVYVEIDRAYAATRFHDEPDEEPDDESSSPASPVPATVESTPRQQATPAQTKTQPVEPAASSNRAAPHAQSAYEPSEPEPSGAEGSIEPEFADELGERDGPPTQTP